MESEIIAMLEAMSRYERRYAGGVLDKLTSEPMDSPESMEKLSKAAMSCGKAEAYQEVADYFKGLPRPFSQAAHHFPAVR
jgi:hypothetical protein